MILSCLQGLGVVVQTSDREGELARGPGVAIHCDLLCAACLDYPFQWELTMEAGF